MVVDIIIIGVIVLSVLFGYKKGLIELGVSFMSFIIAIVATMLLYNPIANLIINTTNIDESIENMVYVKATEIMKGDNSQENQYIEGIKEQATSGVLPETARTISIWIIKIAVFILLIIGIKIALMCIKAFTRLIEKLPIIKQFNKTGGILYGLIRGALIIYILLVLIGIYSKFNSNNLLNENINNSYIGKAMYENNIITIFFDK